MTTPVSPVASPAHRRRHLSDTSMMRMRQRQPSKKVSNAGKGERAFILEQLREGLPSVCISTSSKSSGVNGGSGSNIIGCLDEEGVAGFCRYLLNKMEYYSYQANEQICTAGEMTTPALYVVVDGEVVVSHYGSNDYEKTVTDRFGEELLSRAEFRKTKLGKVVSQLVTAPYSVRSGAGGSCRLAILTAVVYREALKDHTEEDEEDALVKEEDDDGKESTEDEQQVEDKSETTAEVVESEDEEEEEEADVTEASASEGAAEPEAELDAAGRKVAQTNIRRMFLPPKNVSQERLEGDLDDFVRPVHEKTKKETKKLLKAMNNNPLLKSLPSETFDHVVAAMKRYKVKAGERVTKKGREDKYYTILCKGECQFGLEGVGHFGGGYDEDDGCRFSCKAGTTFGEEALTARDGGGVFGGNRVHSIRAKTDVEVYKVDHMTYRKIVAKDTHDERKLKLDLLGGVDFLENISYDNREKLLGILEPKEFHKGEVIFTKEESARTFFIISAGVVECRDVSSKLLGDQPNVQLGTKEHFGDHILSYNVANPKRAEVVGSSESGTVYKIDKDKMKEVIGTAFDLIPVEVRTLGSIVALRRDPTEYLDHKDIVKLSHRIQNMNYKAGTVIVEQDEEIEPCIYIVRVGKVKSTSGRMATIIVPGSYFGEEFFLQCRKMNKDSGVSKSRFVAETTCVVGTITMNDYIDCMSDATDIASLAAAAQGPSKQAQSKESREKKEKQLKWPRCDVGLSELDKRLCLGQGNYGQVWLVADKEGNQALPKPCVLKIQSKHHLVSMGQVKVCIEEKNLLQDLCHPFVVDLLNAYQDGGFVYMLLEFLPGGELYNVLNPPEGPAILPEPLAKFYALAIADALAYMHSKSIIYRDLKPENVLIDRQGFPKLIDFGFAKRIDGPTYTLCGTPGYIAPEVVLNVGHGKSYDHWQLGVLMYDMLSYEAPFYDPDVDQNELFQYVVACPVPEIEGEVSPEARDLIIRLLEKDPKQRLGSLKLGERDILQHKWFKSISLSKLRKRTITVPWKPDIGSDPWDTSNFEDWSDVDDIAARVFKKLEPENARLFNGFG